MPTDMEQPAPDSPNFLNWVEIKNFKSIKDLRLDCKRINIFIGKPNVGKSNILEALGMLGVRGLETQKFMEGSLRYNTIDQLFIDNDIHQSIKVTTNLTEGILTPYEVFELAENRYELNWLINKSLLSADGKLKRSVLLKEDGVIESTSSGVYTKRENRDYFESDINGPIKKYDFANVLEFRNMSNKYLLPPSGNNLYEIVNRRKKLWEEFAKLFQEQGLEFVLSDTDRTFVLQKREGHKAKHYSYFLIADTFRRFMFYIAAIESNSNSVIIFEEPEVHSFPPYTQDIAYRMIYSESNQFFVSTHSPYLLQTLVENLPDDQIQVFVTYYENYETKVKALTSEEFSFVQEYSTDVFFNLDRFIPTSDAASIS